MADENTTDDSRASRGTDEIGSFLVGPCPDCNREVLTARELVDQTVADVCLHCEYRFDRRALEWASASRIAEMGYVIDGYQEDDCETHGGCRGASCGVQQPED